MKNTLIIFLLLIGFSTQAQSVLDPTDYRLKKNEFYASYSPPFFSGTEIGLAITSAIFGGLIDAIFGTVSEEEYHSTGMFHLGYNRFWGQRFSTGFELAYNRFTIDGFTSPGGTKEYSYRLHTLQPQLRADFRYISRPKFQMYSGAHIGVIFGKTRSIDYNSSGMIIDDERSGWELNTEDPSFVFHFNLLGFRFGRNRAFFTELGFGLNSLVRGGVQARF